MSARRIAIVGPESTGKSYLAAQLAQHTDEPWVPEYARLYLPRLPRPYTGADVERMAHGQLALEAALAPLARHWLFCDTNLLVVQVWLEYVFGQCPDWIARAWQQPGRYYHHLLMDVDTPWEADPLREHPHARAELMTIYRQHLEQSGVPFSVVSGAGSARLQAARAALNRK